MEYLIGGYLTGVVFMFMFTGFFYVLGGKTHELWKPFVIAMTWPLALWFFFFKRGS